MISVEAKAICDCCDRAVQAVAGGPVTVYEAPADWGRIELVSVVAGLETRQVVALLCPECLADAVRLDDDGESGIAVHLELR